MMSSEFGTRGYLGPDSSRSGGDGNGDGDGLDIELNSILWHPHQIHTDSFPRTAMVMVIGMGMGTVHCSEIPFSLSYLLRHR